jgi:hypothetical protein
MHEPLAWLPPGDRQRDKSKDAVRSERFVAEREGFEPSMELSPHTRLAGERLQPARPSLRNPANAQNDEPGCEPAVLNNPSGTVSRPANANPCRKKSGGGSRIRTHVPFPGNGFQDRRLKPLGHPSAPTLSIRMRACSMTPAFPRNSCLGNTLLGMNRKAFVSVLGLIILIIGFMSTGFTPQRK